MSKDINDVTAGGGKFNGRGTPQRAPEVRKVALSKLRLEERCQCRATSDAATVEEYAELYRQKRELPPIDAFEVGSDLVVVDGFHRFAAAIAAKLPFLQVRVVGAGSLDDAALRALAANRAHGLKRTNADKRRAVTLALEHPHLGTKSDVAVAEVIGVSATLVLEVRKAIAARGSATPSQPHDSRGWKDNPSESHTANSEKRQGRDGRWRSPPTPPARPNGHAVPPAKPDSEPPAPPPSGKQIPPTAPWDEAAAIARKARLELQALRDRHGLVKEWHHHLEDLAGIESRFRTMAPVPCPGCEGAGCFLCRQRGWVERSKAESQGKAAEARR